MTVPATRPRIAVLTGAGVSAASGIPTFRDAAGGLWQQYRAEDLATPHAFARDPRLVWEFYDHRRQMMAGCLPNPAHSVLAEMEARLPGFTLVTQNIDGLHTLAGSKRVLHLHGNIWQIKCVFCDYRAENREIPLPLLPPICPTCGDLLRPDVVWFDESLPWDVLQQAIRAFEAADLALVVGTSAVVYPAAELPLYTRRRGGQIIEFNTQPTPLSPHALSLFGPSAETLPRWWEQFCREQGMAAG